MMANFFHESQQCRWPAMRPTMVYEDPHHRDAQMTAQYAQIIQFVQPQATNSVNIGAAGVRLVQQRSHLTGYLHSHAKATDNYTGEELRKVLLHLGINMEAVPPLQTVTANAGYPNHGVVKINNVSQPALR